MSFPSHIGTKQTENGSLWEGCLRLKIFKNFVIGKSGTVLCNAMKNANTVVVSILDKAIPF